jgi:RNA polymerase sigma-54 factor
MFLLEMTAAELRQRVENELARNPALELLEEIRCPKCGRVMRSSGPCRVCFRPDELNPEKPLVYFSTREEFYSPRKREFNDDEENSAEEYTPENVTLAEYVLRQVATELTRQEQLIAAHILNSLDEDGLLQVNLVEIARYRNVSLSHVQKVLKIVQRADPLGVGSPTSQQAMLVQLEVLSETQHVPEHAQQAISQAMDLLSHRRFPDLAHRLGVSLKQAKEIARFVANNLNPFPGRAHWGDVSSARRTHLSGEGVYYVPDIIISKLIDEEDSPLVVEIAMPVAGTLRVNPMFRESIQDAPPEKSEEWKADLEQASLLVKCIQQRNNTMVRMLQLLTVVQRDFILNGDEQLQPLTRASLAVTLGLHESTISRAVSDKAVQLPNGHITPLSKFFDRSLHIRSVLKQIIEKESKPLSDAALAKILSQQGHTVARRTVAKYRSMEGILPAHLRRQTAY